MSEEPVRESFVIRVYRRSDEPGREMVGLVEVPARGDTIVFSGFEELRAVLLEGGRRADRQTGSLRDHGARGLPDDQSGPNSGSV